MIDVFTSEGPILPWSITLKVPYAKKAERWQNLEKHVMQTSLVDEVSVTYVTLHK